MVTLRTPHLRIIEGSKQLIVDGSPYLVRGAELQNSSFSSAEYMIPLWQKMVDMNVNTVLGSVSWDIIEPVEGNFNFTEVDRIIQGARNSGLKLVLLWFGAWKNGISTYAPSWVKMNPKRFPRVECRDNDGSRRVTEILTPIYGETIDADMRAFKALMAHLREFDLQETTVVMVQVENEVGILGDSRDYSDKATAYFETNVPETLVHFLKDDWNQLHPDLKSNLTQGNLVYSNFAAQRSWKATFGPGPSTDELFMAYHYASYLNKVASAGKAIYDLPMLANFWLNYHNDNEAMQYPVLAGGGNLPGDYPSGEAVSTVLDIWQRFAPSLDLLCPDTYLNNYHTVCKNYRHRSQPLFIPEQRRDEHGARRVWAAIGAYQALGACPFALDTLEVETCAYTKHYGLLAQVEGVVLEAQRSPSTMVGFFFDELEEGVEDKDVVLRHIAGYEVRIERAFTTGAQGPGYGLVLLRERKEDGTARFFLAGAGFQVKFRSLDPEAFFTGILDFEEKVKTEGSVSSFRTVRKLNGDETRSGQQAIMPNDQPDDGGFPINITIPAATKIAECRVYYLK